jgi:hypothetical protein
MSRIGRLLMSLWDLFMRPENGSSNPDITPRDEREAASVELQDLRAEIEWLNNEVRISLRGQVQGDKLSNRLVNHDDYH